MTVSTVDQIVQEDFAQALAAFESGGVLYALWTSPTFVAGQNHLWWRPHTGANSTEVQAALVRPYARISGCVRATDGALLVLYDDGSSEGTVVWAVAFNMADGAVVMTPRQVAPGAFPNVNILTGAAAGRVTATYAKWDVIYLKESYDDGATWSNEHPVLNNRVGRTTDVIAVPFDSGHLSVMQLGSDAREMREIGSISRTRPMAGILLHPTLDGKVYAIESTQRTVATVDQLDDYQRFALIAKSDGSLVVCDRERKGTDDGRGEVLLLDVSGNAPTVDDEVTLSPGATPGADLVNLSAALVQGTTKDTVFGAIDAAVVDAARSGDLIYAAGYTDQGTDGGLAIYDTGSDTVGLPISGYSVRAVGVGTDASPAVVAIATTEAGQEKLRIYTENGLTPTLKATHKLPAQANAVHVVMDTDTEGRIYVAMPTRLNVYQLDSLTGPMRLILTIPVLTRGGFYQFDQTVSGYLAVATGNGGIAVFSPSGETLAQTLVSGIYADDWKPETAYGVGDFVRPTEWNPYRPQRTYFRCTGAGTSGVNEPPWAPTGSVSDAGATWVEYGILDPVVSGVAIDAVNERIYVAGALGGPAGVEGRVWILEAPSGLLW